MHFVDHKKVAMGAEFSEMQGWGSGDALIGGDVAGEAAGQVVGVVGGADG